MGKTGLCILIAIIALLFGACCAYDPCTNLRLTKEYPTSSQYILEWDPPSDALNNLYRIRCVNGCEEFTDVQWDTFIASSNVPTEFLVRSHPSSKGTKTKTTKTNTKTTENMSFLLGVTYVDQMGKESPAAYINFVLRQEQNLQLARDDSSSSLTTGTTDGNSTTNSTTDGSTSGTGLPASTSTSLGPTSSTSSTSSTTSSSTTSSPSASSTTSSLTSSSTTSSVSSSSTSSISSSSTTSSLTDTTSGAASTSSSLTSTTSPSPSPPSPSPSPSLSPSSTVTLTLVISGDRSQFDLDAFIAALAASLNVSTSQIHVTVNSQKRAESFTVVAQVSYPSASLPDMAQVSAALNSTEMKTYLQNNGFVISSVQVQTPPTQAPTQSPSKKKDNKLSGAIVAAIVVPIVVVLGAIIVAFVMLRTRRRRWEERGVELEKIYKSF